MPSAYRVAPIFLIRMAGVPFETLERLSTRGTTQIARELLVRQDRFGQAKADLEEFLRREHNELPRK